MKLREFTRLVGQMRRAQREFFASAPGSGKRTMALESSRALEKMVDAAVRECLEQPSLFDSKEAK